VDEYLSDKEQVERLRAWWRENGWFLIGGVAIGLLAIYGYRQFFAYQDRQGEAAAALYTAVREAVDGDDAAAAETLFGQLKADYPSNVYTHQAAMLMARTEVVTAPDAAAANLRSTMEQTDDPELAMIARLRLARLLAYREQYDEALNLLEVESPGQFAGRISEVEGDIHAARGDTAAARTAYLEAMVASGAELLDRSFLQMKLEDLPGASSDAAPETAPTGAPAPTETGGATAEPPAGASVAPDEGE
jgi:predicted negative regulator of RcsB-dependent stress response